MPAQLPKPDRWGNFWFGSKKGDRPAIMSSRRVVAQGETEPTGKWIVFMGSDLGFLFAGIDFLPFDSPQSALLEVNRRLEAAGKA